jgi:hypothetical protein
MNKDDQAKQILRLLETQRFANWYNDGGRFDYYIRGEYPDGDPRQPTQESILEDIKKMFQLS